MYVCRRCGRRFTSARGLNLHLSRSHLRDPVPPVYFGEGVEEVRREGDYVSVRLRVRRGLWEGVERAVAEGGLDLSEALVAALVNITAYGVKWEEEARYII